MEAVLYDEMYATEERHWWFRTRRAIVVSLLRDLLDRAEARERPLRVCDIGCGCGMMLVELQRNAFECVGIDMYEQAVAHCRKRGVDARKGALPDGLRLPDESVDAVLLLHVLEHVAEDRESLLAAERLLRPGGVLICMVPAYPWLWSRRDEYSHHKRRYTRGGLRRVLASAPDSEVLHASYIHSLLFPLFVAQILKWKLRPPVDAGGQYRLPAPGLGGLFRAVSTVDWFGWRHGMRLPWGVTVLGVLRKRLREAGTADRLRRGCVQALEQDG